MSVAGGAPVVLAPMRAEARALARAAPGLRVVRAGAGRRAAQSLRGHPGDGPLVVAGVGGGLDPRLRSGTVVVATSVLGPAGELPCPDPDGLLDVLAGHGLAAVAGAVATVTRPALGRARPRLAATGALVADMESAWVVAAAAPRPVAVVRVVLDTPRRPGTWPASPWTAWSAASTVLARVGAALEEWTPVLMTAVPVTTVPMTTVPTTTVPTTTVPTTTVPTTTVPEEQ